MADIEGFISINSPTFPVMITFWDKDEYTSSIGLQYMAGTPVVKYLRPPPTPTFNIYTPTYQV